MITRHTNAAHNWRISTATRAHYTITCIEFVSSRIGHLTHTESINLLSDSSFQLIDELLRGRVTSLTVEGACPRGAVAMRAIQWWAFGLMVSFLLLAGCASNNDEGAVRRTTQALCADGCGLYVCDDGTNCYDWCRNDDYCALGAHCNDDLQCVGAEGGDCTLYAPNPDGGCNTWCARDSDCTEFAFCGQGSGECVPDLCIGKTLDDGNACTYDYCDRETGNVTRVYAPVHAGCRDQTACNGSEECDGHGVCLPGTPILTDDGDACTLDACDPETGAVSHTGFR